MKFEDKVIKFSLGIGYVGHRKDEHKLSDCFTEDEWSDLTDDEKQKAIDEIAEEWAYNYIDLSGYVE